MTSKNEQIIPINDIKKFITEIERIQTLAKDLLNKNPNKYPTYQGKFSYDWYFRGQAKSHIDESEADQTVNLINLLKTLKPSIYRKNLVQYEHQFYKDAILSNPDEFRNDKSAFEKLVRMQHYDIPTRLLDITSNALMALYFACEDGYNDSPKDGFVFHFLIPKNDIKYYDSDTVSVLSNLAKMPCSDDFSIELDNFSTLKNLTEFRKILKDILEKTQYKSQTTKFNIAEERMRKISKEGLSIDGVYKIINFYRTDKNADKKPNKPLKNKLKKAIIRALNEEPSISQLVHEIREEKPYFESRINVDHFSKIICVKPLLTNRRLIRQDGAFLLFGMNVKKNNYPPLSDDWVPQIYKIEAASKQKILTSLASLGITKDKVYPELDKVGEYLKYKYSTKDKND